MNAHRKICAVVPVKDTRQAKHRLAGVLDEARRRRLALAMFEDVLDALAWVRGLAGILTVTADPAAAAIAIRYGSDILREGASAGHTGAVAAAARALAAHDFAMLTLPADVPLVEANDIRRLIRAHRSAVRGRTAAFTIVPARDQRGSNAALCAPADAVPLRFGDDSFLPHLLAAKERGIEPSVLRLPRIALDIDTPGDLALLRNSPSHTRARALLERWQLHRDEKIKAIA
jgi:2-phospho-L-lactate guanylyltransferase